MESEENAASQVPKSSLFPAYSASLCNNNTESSLQQEWLHNSSFVPENLEILTDQHKSENDDNIVISDETTEVYQCEKRRKKKRYLKLKNQTEQNEKLPDHLSVKFLKEGDVSLQSHLSKLIFIEETGLSIERAYRLDSKRDNENIAFGAFDRKAIARTSQKFAIPMGSSHLELSHWLKLSKRKKMKGVSRYYTKEALKQLKVNVDNSDIYTVNKIKQAELNYIPLLAFDKTKVVGSTETKCFDRTFEDLRLNFYDSPESGQAVHDDTPLLPLLEQELYNKTAYYNNAVMKNPHDEKIWISFVDFQNELFQSLLSFKSSNVTERNVLEKQVAILDKALQHNPNSVKLTVLKLKLCRNFWEMKEVVSGWENLMFYHPNDILAWQEFLQFVTSDIAYFTVQRMTKLYSKCLRTLSDLLDGKIKSHLAPTNLQQSMIVIFRQYCTILQCCGYSERALGLFQALVEFNLFAPDIKNNISSCSEWIAFFEPFWDTGSPRIGEDNAVGWATTVSEQKINVNLAASVLGLEAMEDTILSYKFPHWKTWIEFEKLRQTKHWLPWRPNPELEQTSDDLDDPDRMISFDDISLFIFKVNDENSKFLLLINFLHFLGVNLHSLDCCQFAQNFNSSQFILEDLSNFSDILKDIFPNKHVPDALKLEVYLKHDDINRFIENVFKQTVSTFSVEYSPFIYFIWIKYKINYLLKYYRDKDSYSTLVENVKKMVKNFLKKNENRNCLFLWAEYLYLEYLSCSREKAMQMYETLLISTGNSVPIDAASHKLLCYFAQIYVCLFGGMKYYNGLEKRKKIDSKDILHVLSYVGSRERYVPYKETTQLNSTLLIKAQKGFQNILNKELSLLTSHEQILCICINPYLPVYNCLFCSAYFSYFTHGLTSAMKICSDTLKIIQEKMMSGLSESLRFIEEQITLLQTELLNFHTWNSTSAVKPLQTHLINAVEKFPNDVPLLHMLVKIKSASSVIGPTRRFFHNLLKSNRKLTCVTWLFAIISEFIICESVQEPFSRVCVQNSNSGTSMPICGLVWKIRSLFEKALQSESSRHFVALWRCYIKFEVCNDNLSKAKSVLHQSIENCPWSKALLLDGIQYFPEDIAQFLSVMNEKQLRVHTPLEEIALLMEHAA